VTLRTSPSEAEGARYAIFQSAYSWRDSGAIMGSAVIAASSLVIAASLVAIILAVVSYYMREVHRREQRAVHGLQPSAFLRNPD
jgi:hypothetical protein